MTPEQSAAVARVREAVAQANLCMPPLSTIIVATDDAAAILAALDAAQAALVHITHCNFGEHAGSCKYGDENCPALSDGLSWIGKGLDAGQAVSKWETTLSAVMPADFKDWHQNSRAEWPEMAAWVIQNLREREAEAWKHVERMVGEETRQALIAWAVSHGREVAAAQAPRTPLEQYDLDHSPEYRKGYEDGRLKGYGVGHRHAQEAAQAPREAPRLTCAEIREAFDRLQRDESAPAVFDLPDFTTGACWAEARVRELCGVAP